jgi:hypothetical protein
MAPTPWRNQALTNVLIRHLMELSGTIVTAHEITQMPRTDLVRGDLTPHQLLRLENLELAPRFVENLKRFRYGPGTFKIDYALNLCCCDLDGRVASQPDEISCGNLPAETSGAREGSKSFLHHLGFANGKRHAQESPYPVHKITSFMT